MMLATRQLRGAMRRGARAGAAVTRSAGSLGAVMSVTSRGSRRIRARRGGPARRSGSRGASGGALDQRSVLRADRARGGGATRARGRGDARQRGWWLIGIRRVTSRSPPVRSCELLMGPAFERESARRLGRRPRHDHPWDRLSACCFVPRRAPCQAWVVFHTPASPGRKYDRRWARLLQLNSDANTARLRERPMGADRGYCEHERRTGANSGYSEGEGRFHRETQRFSHRGHEERERRFPAGGGGGAEKRIALTGAGGDRYRAAGWQRNLVGVRGVGGVRR